jgi:hypothetical protein
LEATLGRLADAVADAHRSIAHADKGGEAFWRMGSRTRAADALHQTGQRSDAGALFAQAERMQKERQPQFELLYSVQGFVYCDWLLAPAECAAWQVVLRGLGTPSTIGEQTHGRRGIDSVCAEIERRATTTLKWMVDGQMPLLDLAVDQLTLARVGLIRAILTHPLPQPALDVPYVAAAIGGLRNAGQVDYLAKGLPTAALYNFVRGEHDLARVRLDEAQQIAERGPMPLYLADIHLHRARFFRDKSELAKAAKLIRDLGYGRRYDELADAEAALGVQT